MLPNSGFDYNASFSADGKWIIFTSERGGSADIYRVHPDGSGLERLTDEPAYDDQGALSPDGKQLVFVSSRGTGPPTSGCSTYRQRRCETLPAPDNFRPSWSPDGKWIAFSSDRNTPVRRDGERFEQSHAVSIYLMRTDGTDVRRITSVANLQAHRSGRQMARESFFMRWRFKIRSTLGFPRPSESRKTGRFANRFGGCRNRNSPGAHVRSGAESFTTVC